MIFRKVDKKGRTRKYIKGPCFYCKKTHTVLYNGYKKFNRICHKKCFFKYGDPGHGARGFYRRTREKMINKVISGYIKSAERRELTWALSYEEFYNMSQLACTYCGVPPRQHHAGDAPGPPMFIFNGVDRVNNNRGYEVDNCVTCCYQCNLSKRNLTMKDWMNYLSRLVLFRKDM